MKIQQQKYAMTQVYEWNEYMKQGHSATETSKKFGVPYKSMLNLLNRHKLRIPTRHTPARRKNPYNIDYFDNIDSHKKAYFLGLLYADGYICSGNYESSKQVGIALQLCDKYIIEELYNELNLKTKLNIYKNSVKLVVTDVHLYNTLVNLGLQENKSYKDFVLPNIDEKFLNSFLLGFFDGDGCITNIQRTPKVEMVCNSKIFLESVQEYLQKNNISSTISIDNQKKHLFILTINKHINRVKFAQLIYSDSPVYLKRKHERFIITNLIALPS